jgi:Tol biopolymer transport system component
MSSRRNFIQMIGFGAAGAALGCRTSPATQTKNSNRFLFTSQGKTGMINADGTGLRYFDFEVPNQATWQPGPFLADGRRVLFLSMEPRRDGPGRPFEEYYTQTPTHLWVYDLDRETLTEIANKERMAVFYTPALLLTDERLLVQVVKDKVGQIFSMNLDGTDAREFTHRGEGLPYGLSASRDGKRVAFHLATPEGYQIWTSDQEGKNRIKVAANPDHLYFGTSWSPDDQWILYQDCAYKTDAGHDWSDICIGRADGSEHRLLTTGQPQWFAATYGSRSNRGGGSNMPRWTREGKILFSRKLPNSKVPWEYQPARPDTDHFNRDFKPDLARGGTEISLLDPSNGSVTPLTKSDPPQWDFRASPSQDGRQIVFCRCRTGESPAIWVMDHTGSNQKLLTSGINDLGADHPAWLPRK